MRKHQRQTNLAIFPTNIARNPWIINGRRRQYSTFIERPEIQNITIYRKSVINYASNQFIFHLRWG